MSEPRRRRKAQRQVTVSMAGVTRIIAMVLLIGLVAFLMIHKI